MIVGTCIPRTSHMWIWSFHCSALPRPVDLIFGVLENDGTSCWNHFAGACIPRTSHIWFPQFHSIIIGLFWEKKTSDGSPHPLLWFCHGTELLFLRITQYIGDTHHARTLIPMNRHTQTLPLGASSKTVPANPQDWRSHHRRLAIDGNVAYHWKHKRY
jgi:hypothetical protein